MIRKRVEIEFIKGNDNWHERRIFEAETVTLKPNEYVHVVSSKDGEFYYNLREQKVLWISIEPIEVEVDAIKQKVLQAMDPSKNYSQLINGIKVWRDLTGGGLKEGKEYCENLRSDAIPF